MIGLFLVVEGIVKVILGGADILHEAANAKRAVDKANALRAAGPLCALVQPPVRAYATMEEGIRGEDEGSLPDIQRAESRFKELEPLLPHCARCEAPVVDPMKYYARGT